MFVPIPVLVVIGAIFILLIALALRSSRRRDPLLGGQSSAYPPVPMRYQAPAHGSESTPPRDRGAILSPEVEAQVIALISAGRKIEAIKVVKEATRLGLKDSKDLVEGLPSG